MPIEMSEKLFPPGRRRLLPHGSAPLKVWLIFPHDGGAPVLWTEPCPFPVDDGTVVEYRLTAIRKGDDHDG